MQLIESLAEPKSILGDCASGEWYAIQTRPRHEQKIATDLQAKGIASFVPTVREVHRWSDRRKVIIAPLFMCYAFVRTDCWRQINLPVLRTSGVIRWVGINGEPSAIPSAEVESIEQLIKNGIPTSPHDYLKIGQRVRICGGALDGVEGILTGRHGDRRLVISVTLIQQSVSLSLQGYDVEPVR